MVSCCFKIISIYEINIFYIWPRAGHACHFSTTIIILFCQTYQVKKKIQGDGVFGIPVVKKTRHATSEVDPCLPDSLLAQHIGELLAYVDSSVTHMDLCGNVGRDILGFTVEKTHVRDT